MIGTSVIKELIEQIILGKKNGYFHPKEKEAIDTKKKFFFLQQQPEKHFMLRENLL